MTATIRRGLAALICGLALAGPAAAESIALVIGNVDYQEMPDSPLAARAFGAEQAFRRAGIDTTVARNADLAGIRQILPQFLQMTSASDGQIVVLAGKFANDGVETFFLPADMPEPTLLNLYRRGLALSLYVSLLKNAPAGGLLVLMPADSRLPTSGPNWSWGLGPIDAVEGVAVLHGSTRDVARFLEGVVPNPDIALRGHTRGLTVLGDLPAKPFLSGAEAGSVRDGLAWDLARGLDTAAAYRSYLAQHPEGAHAEDARRRLAALTAPTPQEVEVLLGLTRDQRRDIQRDLSLLGHNTRGIDGIFGAGTRTAVRAWQAEEGLRETGYLTALQVQRLARQAEARRAEIRREDQDFWTRTGAKGTEAGLNRYLDRYPQGIHAAEARKALAGFAAERRAVERAAWDTAQSADTLHAYQRYLDAYPDGEHAEAARDRIDEIEARKALGEARRAAADEEASLNLTPFAKMLAERRLAQEGYGPGAIDGVFDEETRRAIRRMQKAAGLPPTGYLTEDTIAALLAGGLRQLLDQ